MPVSSLIESLREEEILEEEEDDLINESKYKNIKDVYLDSYADALEGAESDPEIDKMLDNIPEFSYRKQLSAKDVEELTDEL